MFFQYLKNTQTVTSFFMIAFLYLSGIWYVYDYTVDDAFISLRYAENLVVFGQLSFNPGDPPQEGYTNFLLVLIEALFIASGLFNSVTAIPKITGVLSGLATIFFTFRLSQLIFKNQLTNNSLVLFLPAASLALSTPFIVWSVAGLETVLFTFLVTAASYYYLRLIESNILKYGYISEMFFFLSALCRPEGLLFWGMSYLISLIHYKKAPIASKFKTGAFFILLFVLYLLWKLSYFGNVLPLTYYAKHSSLKLKFLLGGIRRFSHYLMINMNLIYVLLFFISIIFSLIKRNIKLIFLNALIFTFFFSVFKLGFTVAMDECFRLYVPAIPFLYISAVSGLLYLTDKYAITNSRSFSMCLAFFYMLQIFTGYHNLNTAWLKDVNFGAKTLSSHNVGLKRLNEEWINSSGRMGLWLHDNVPPDTTIVVGDIGMIGYYSKLTVIDNWSLVNKTIVMLQRKQRKHTPYSVEHQQINQKINDFILGHDPDIIVGDFTLSKSKNPKLKQYVPLLPEHYSFFNQIRFLYVKKDLVDKNELHGYVVENPLDLSLFK